MVFQHQRRPWPKTGRNPWAEGLRAIEQGLILQQLRGNSVQPSPFALVERHDQMAHDGERRTQASDSTAVTAFTGQRTTGWIV